MREKIENDLRVIKKYGSRRLYDTKDSCYIAFLELGKIIAEGKEFQIFDAKTKDDVTHEVIVSYLIENQHFLDHLSNDFLKECIKIQGYGSEQKKLFSKLYETSFNFFLNQIPPNKD
jgi:hypothetical protein